MNETQPYLDIVIFAMIAVFLGLRLRSVLGRRNPDQEQPPQALNGPSPVVDLNARRARAPDTLPSDPLAAGLARIAAADASFDPDQFLQGAQAAFEMIVGAFAAGDVATLRPLLSDAVFADFSHAIAQRQGTAEDHRLELVRIVSVTLADAKLEGRIAEIAVRFVSEQKPVQGDGADVKMIDLWRFARDVSARDPNWRLVATGTIDS